MCLASVLDYHRHGDSDILNLCTCIRPRLPQALRLCHRILDCIPTVLASVLDYHRHCDLVARGSPVALLASVLDCHRHCDSARTNCSLHPSSITTGTATNRVVGMQA